MTTFRQFSEHYSVLAFILATGLIALFFFRYNSDMQRIVLWATIGSYVLWGVGHHYLRKDLTFKIVLEYFLVALIGGLLSQATLLQR